MAEVPHAIRIGRWRKLLLFVASIAVVSLFLELLLAICGLFPPEPRLARSAAPSQETFFRLDPRLGWLLKPDTSFELVTEGRIVAYRAGPDGFRCGSNAEPAATPSRAKRIAFVGDSMTYGIGVTYEETFAARTSAAFGAVALNRAMPGFGVDQMWLAMRDVALPEKPDLVVVTIIEDDFERSLHPTGIRLAERPPKPSFKLESDRLVPKGPADEPSAPAAFFERNSRLLAAWRGAERRISRRWPMGPWWSVNQALVDAMIDDAREAGVPLLFVYMPVSGRWQPFPALEQHLEKRGAAYVDLGREWRPSPEDAYFPSDGHLSPGGHERAAEVLERVIRERWPTIAQP